MGAERKSMLLTDEEKRVTAYHEAGHALVSFFRDHSDPIHKVTIIPRGMALGVTIFLPGDRHNYTREYLEAKLAMSYGGRVAEEIFLNQMSTGAGSDIEVATDLARRMVCEYGMSRLGPLTFGKKEEQIFLGREIAQHRDFSEETARQIDLEVRRLIDEAYQSAHNLIDANQDAMHRIAAALLERETIDSEELRLLIEGKELPAMRSALAGPSDGDSGSQQVLKPESPRGPGSGLPEGSPSPA
jgi:cell division protease FtsH